MMIRKVQKSDAQDICSIYNHYIRNSIATFDEEPLNVEQMEERIVMATDELPWLVFEEKDRILGYAYASKWKGRCAYRFSVESTIYLSPESTGRGIGLKLYKALIHRLSELSYHSIIGGISLPNPASITLHEKLGFEKVAHFKEVGWKMDRWIDVGYWELIVNNL